MRASISLMSHRIFGAGRRGNARFQTMFRVLRRSDAASHDERWTVPGRCRLAHCPARPATVNAVRRFPPGLLETRFPRGIVRLSAVAFSENPMAPRANWKGFLRLSLVTCPVALYPATSDTEKVSFNQINRKTGHRIKYAKVDADTGEEVASEDIMKGYKVDTDTYIEMSKEELDEFVPKSDIDGRYLIRPYYLVPDGKVGHDAFAVIRETVRSMNKVAIGRVVLTNREHIIALEPLGKGLMGTLLRYPYEVRSEKEYFDDIQDVKITKDMLDLAKPIVEKKSRSFEPDKFEDHYEAALIELINKKRSGIRTTAKAAPKTAGNVINLMDALKRSLASERPSPPPAKAKGKKPRKAASGQREMLLPISGKRAGRLKGRYARPLDRKKPDNRYFSEALTDVNPVLRVLPMPLTAVIITMLRPTAIRQYSMAVAPDSSLRNLEISGC